MAQNSTLQLYVTLQATARDSTGRDDASGNDAGQGQCLPRVASRASGATGVTSDHRTRVLVSHSASEINTQHVHLVLTVVGIPSAPLDWNE